MDRPQPGLSQGFEDLRPGDRRLLRLLKSGLAIREAAQTMGISYWVARDRLSALGKRVGCRRLSETLVAYETWKADRPQEPVKFFYECDSYLYAYLHGEPIAVVVRDDKGRFSGYSILTAPSVAPMSFSSPRRALRSAYSEISDLYGGELPMVPTQVLKALKWRVE